MLGEEERAVHFPKAGREGYLRLLLFSEARVEDALCCPARKRRLGFSGWTGGSCVAVPCPRPRKSRFLTDEKQLPSAQAAFPLPELVLMGEVMG